MRVMGDITLHTTRYGRPAAALLHARIAALKAEDPLSPVSVVVPTNYVGVSTRRLLAGGALGPVTARGNGIVGLSLLTVYRLAELLGAPALAAAGRRPVSTPVIAAAVRRVLGSDAGLFADIATHPSTEEGLVRTYRELSELQPASLDRLAGRSTRAADVVRIHRAVRDALFSDWFIEADLMAAATDAVRRRSSVLDDLGAVLVYLPQSLSLPAAQLLKTVGEQATVEVIAARTGDEQADTDVDRALRRLDLDLPPQDAPAPITASAIVSVSDAEEEVRTAVEQIIAASRRDVPLERMAILYPTLEPYARLVHEQLTAAGIASNGAAVRPLSDRLLGRWLLDLLALADQRYSRPAVMALLSAGPLRGTDGWTAAAGAWERVSREAGIVRGADEWDHKLKALAEDLRARAVAESASQEPREWRMEQFQRDADHADALRTFTASLFDRLQAAQSMTTWADLATWAHDMIERYVGDERRRGAWPEVERSAAERVEAAVDRLAGLDSVEPSTSLDVFRRTLRLELDDDLGRVGSFGQGVLVGTMSAALGVDLDVVIVLGMAEGVCPSRIREDSLLPDIERIEVRDELPLRAERIGAEHRQLLAALSAADHRVLVYPRGDLRRSIERTPSRWLLDCCVAAGRPRQLPAEADWYRKVPSFAARMRTAAFPATRQQYGLRALGSAGSRHDLQRHPLVAGDPVMGRGIELLLHRGGHEFTRFDGNLAGVVDALPAPDAPDSLLTATQLESWLSCPHAYFMQYVLRVRPVENPEELLTLDALERGSLMHDVLERWLLRRIEEGPPPPGTRWSEASRAEMRRLAEDACDRAERRGITGHPLLWRRDRDAIIRDLVSFVDADDLRRAQLGLTPDAAELPFGMAGADPLVIDLGDGTAIRLRGRIDRTDRATDGRVVVADYKTGKADSYKGLTEEQPLGDGTRLQLGLYGLAVAAAAGAAGVHSEYWFTSARGRFSRVGYPVTAAVEAEVRRALGIVVDGMRRGTFPMKPAEPGFRVFTDCRFCDPDDLGTTDRFREWETIRHDPQLHDYVAFVEPEVLADAQEAT